MENCNIVKDLLVQYLNGETSDETDEKIEAHLAECAECKAALKRLKKERNQKLRERIRSLPWRKYIKRGLAVMGALLVLAALVVTLVCPVRHYNEPTAYTKKDVRRAFECVEKDFGILNTGILLSLSYDEDFSVDETNYAHTHYPDNCWDEYMVINAEIKDLGITPLAGALSRHFEVYPCNWYLARYEGEDWRIIGRGLC